ncbi:MAG: xanthine dehydrogenase family protein subunit M [Deltaproteobacteria bacterium]|nr:xanthine dehydrogenase family protein subunit M [Deltaproteobacteria bacterium]
MRSDVRYVRPSSLGEAVGFLSDHGPETKPLAGGTDLLISIRSGELKARYVMDVNRIPELKGIAMTGEGLSIGAGTTIAEIASSETVKRLAPVLRKSCLSFGSPQVRNAATIGGNIANASPSADTFPPLIVHETIAVLSGPDGERRIPVEEAAAGPYKSNVGSRELIVRFILKPSEGRFFEFLKIGRRKTLAIARVSMAVLAEKDMRGAVGFIRFCLGSSTPVPCRIVEVEDFLTGKILNEAVVAEGGRLAAEKMIEISGRRSTTVYKEPAVKGLFNRLLYPMVKND